MDKEIKIKMPPPLVDADKRIGTSYQGCFPEGVTYDELLVVFGPPNMDTSKDPKTEVEWFGDINGKVFTIYCYKIGCKWLGADGKDVESITGEDWHIGCLPQDKNIADLVTEYFRQHSNV